MESDVVVPIMIGMGGPRGVFAYLVRAERPMLIDAGIPDSAPQILEILAAEGIDPHDLGLILITHGHTDHTGSAWELKQATGAPVAIQRADAYALERGESAPVVGRTPQAQAFIDGMAARRAERAAAVTGFPPDVIIDEEASLEDFGVHGRAIHMPGHTEGGLVVLLDSGEALVGDLVGADASNAHVPAPAMFAVNADEMDASIRRIVSLEPRVVYAGHAGPFTIEQMRRAFEG